MTLTSGPLAHPVAEERVLHPELFGHFWGLLIVVVVVAAAVVVVAPGLLLLIDEL